MAEKDGVYSVRTTYDLIQGPSTRERDPIFKMIWKCAIPSNTCAFIWRMFHDRIQTKTNLRRRNILQADQDVLCCFCSEEEESLNHLFFTCRISSLLWNACNRWLGIVSAGAGDCRRHFLQFALPDLCGNRNDLLKVIWGACVWSLWCCRNNAIFRGGHVDVDLLLNLVQVRSWKWLSARCPGFNQSLFEWVSNPVMCLAFSNV